VSVARIHAVAHQGWSVAKSLDTDCPISGGIRHFRCVHESVTRERSKKPHLPVGSGHP
jgi:hypothetical protein